MIEGMMHAKIDEAVYALTLPGGISEKLSPEPDLVPAATKVSNPTTTNLALHATELMGDSWPALQLHEGYLVSDRMVR